MCKDINRMFTIRHFRYRVVDDIRTSALVYEHEPRANSGVMSPDGSEVIVLLSYRDFWTF